MTKKRKRVVKISKKIIKEPKKIEEEGIKKIKIRLIGIGGGGGNIVSEIAQNVSRASFFVADSDSKALKNLPKNLGKFQFGQNLTRGLGTGMNPEIGREAAKNEREKIKRILEGQDLIILIACLGGGIGSGATPVFARISKNLGNLTYGIFTLPFKFEGEKKMEIARSSLRELRRNLNGLTLLPNEKIFQTIGRNISLKKSLSLINKNLIESLQSLIEIIYRPGLINIDFADFRTIFEGRGRLTYLNSIETEKEKIKAGIETAINSPLYPYGIEGAKGVLLNIAGQKDLSLNQVSQISKTISERVNKEAKIIFGISPTYGYPKESSMKITILATGCSLLKPLKSYFLGLEKPKRLKPEKKKKTPIRLQPVPKVKKIEVEKKTEEKPKIESPKKGEEDEKVVRKNALQVKKEIEEAEREIVEKEKFWETPAFLRKKFKVQ